MRLLACLGLGAAVLVGGCAKFPAFPDDPGFTRVIFRMRVAGNIRTVIDNPTGYIYNVAIRASEELDPADSLAPQAIFQEGAIANGRMAGSPTHFVEFDTQNPTGAEPFILYRFATQAEAPNPQDPTNPINLNVFQRSTRGRIVNYQNYMEDPREIRFDIFVNLLADSDEAARRLNTLQVNFLTMNRLASQGGATRLIDALGRTNSFDPNERNVYVRVDLRREGVISNDIGQTQGIEPPQDLYPTGPYDPDLDIVFWSIEVQRRT
jgi:hypothetical protein